MANETSKIASKRMGEYNEQYGFEDFRRYHDGEMSPEEQYRFERSMMRERGLEDAYEGYLAMRGNHVDTGRVRKSLGDALGKRTGASQARVIPFRTIMAAACVLLAAGILWLGYVSEGNKNMMSEELAMEKPVLKPTPEPLQGSNPIPHPAEAKPEPAPPARSGTEIASKPESLEEVIETDEIEEHLADASLISAASPEHVISVEPSGPGKKNGIPANTPGQDSAPLVSSYAGRYKSDKLADKKGKTVQNVAVSTETLARAPAAAQHARRFGNLRDTAAMASRAVAPEAEIKTSTRRAAPAEGWEAFRAYLAETIRNKTATTEVLVVFTVGPDGKLTDFKVDGPENLRQRAIEIIQKGPAWQPAQRDGRPVASPVTLSVPI